MNNNNSNYHPPPAADSFAARSAQAYGNVNVNVNGTTDGSGGMNMNGQMGGAPGNMTNGHHAGQHPPQQPSQQLPQPSYGQAYPPPPQQQQMNMPPGPPPPPQQQQQQFQQPPMNMMPSPQQQQAPQQPPQQFYPQQQQQPQQAPMQIPQPYSQQSQFHVTATATKHNPLDQILNDSIRRMQESTHIMHGAMEANDLATTLDRAAAMLGELGDPKHHHHQHHHHHHHGHSHAGSVSGSGSSKEPKAIMSPKHYYELHMMALEELPNLEEFFLSFTATGIAPPNPNPPMIMMPQQQSSYGMSMQMPMSMPVQVPPATLRMTMKDLYEIVQYCPRAVPRLYLQICAGSALIRSGEMEVKHVLQELKDAVKCVQCPIRGLFLRHYLLQAVKDKLPDECEVSDVVNVDANVNVNVNAGINAGDVGEGGQESQVNINPEDAATFQGGVLDTSLNTMEKVEDQMDNFQKEMDETMLKQTKALEDLMGDFGVDDHDSTTSAKDEIDTAAATVGATNANATAAAAGPNDTMNDLMGGLDSTNTGGGLFDDVNINVAPTPTPVPSTMPPMLPPMPAPVPPSVAVDVSVASANQEEKQLDDSTTTTGGTVKDSYQFVLSNFIEMNKLWVRIQHMPGDSKAKEIKRKRERERNELRMMVGTNLVRLSELEGVTSALYGTVILPTVLDQIVACHDPLAQAYLMDCIIQVFPDEFHIQTLEVVLSVCPKLREKVNIRTILQSVMNRLANYYADELLLNDEEDTEGVKMSVMLDSYHMFDDCIKSVFNARGPKLTAREAIRLESSLLDFSLKCYPGRMDYIDQCLGNCASALRGEITVTHTHSISNTEVPPTPIELDNSAITELEKILSMPLEEMALNILGLEHYSELLALLPWDNRRKVAVTLLQVLDTSEQQMTNIREMDQLFAIMTPLLQNNVGGGRRGPPNDDDALVAKVIHLIYNEDTDVHFEMLSCAKRRISSCGDKGTHIVPLFYEALNLLNRIKELEFPAPLPMEEPETDVEEEGEQVDTEEEQEEEKTEAEEVEPEEEKEERSEAEKDSPVVSDEKVEDEDIVDDDKDDTESGDVDDNKDSSGNTDADDQISEADADDVDVDASEQVKGTEQKIDEKNVEEEVSSPTETQQPAGDQTQPSKNELFGISKDDLFGDAPMEGDETLIEQTPELPSFTKEITCRKVFLFIQKILLSLRSSNDMEQTISCSLNAATAASSCFLAAVIGGFDGSCFTPIAYEFFTETFHIYESSVLDAKVQQRLLVALIGSLLVSARSFGEADYETLITKVTQYAARLVKKTDQCKTVMLCSHLFYSEESGYKNPKRALECLQRALKVADACVNASPSNLQLFVDIFDCYLYHFEKQNPVITDRFISGLIALINEHIVAAGQNPVVADSKFQFIQTVRYIEQKKNDAVSFSHFGQIACKIPN